jgi:hypothetical protein
MKSFRVYFVNGDGDRCLWSRRRSMEEALSSARDAHSRGLNSVEIEEWEETKTSTAKFPPVRTEPDQ